MGLKSIFSFIAVSTLCTCIDPFNPEITGKESLLVVDGLITDANSSYYVRLSRTIQKQDSNPVMVSNATLFIRDDIGKSSYLLNQGNGLYKTDSIEFIGIAGRTYVLHILTADGLEYESEPCQMKPGADIDTIYYAKDNELVNNGTESLEGIRIFLDSKGGEADIYYRWDFEETWMFKVPNPKKYDYLLEDSVIAPHQPVNEYCWKSRKSDEILINPVNLAEDYSLKKIPVFFIASKKSDRLLIQYSILVRQHSISKKEYDFWDNLKSGK